MDIPRHEKADPKCRDCHGYGYIHIDDVLVERQTVRHYTEYAYEPVFAECHCTESIEQKLNEATNRTTPDHF